MICIRKVGHVQTLMPSIGSQSFSQPRPMHCALGSVPQLFLLTSFPLLWVASIWREKVFRHWFLIFSSRITLRSVSHASIS
jgi:hypothetical protein